MLHGEIHHGERKAVEFFSGDFPGRRAPAGLERTYFIRVFLPGAKLLLVYRMGAIGSGATCSHDDLSQALSGAAAVRSHRQRRSSVECVRACVILAPAARSPDSLYTLIMWVSSLVITSAREGREERTHQRQTWIHRQSRKRQQCVEKCDDRA